MWRNSLHISSKLSSSAVSTSTTASNHRLKLALIHSYNGVNSAAATTTNPHNILTTPPQLDPLKLGFQKTDLTRSFATASVSDISCLSSVSKSRGGGVVDVARHYGQCYWELSKAKLSMLVVATSGTGFVLGSGSAIDYAGLGLTCAGTMMVAASASTLNQVFEIKNDAIMRRTSQRPLPSGRITKHHAIAWATSVGVAGTALLACQTNMLAAGLAASNLVLYAFVYTPLKQIHPVNTWVGAVVGAIPPLLGWAAASGEVSLNGMILPAALYFWQLPHFMALAYMCRKDYADGGFRMLSLADASGRRTSLVALRNCLYLVPLGFLAYEWGITSGWFCLESSLLAAAISATAFSFYRERTLKSAKRMFHASLLYLPVFMSGLLFHRVTDNDQSLTMENKMMKITKLPSSLFASQEKENEDEKNIRKHFVSKRQPHAPVAYASSAPFPFLPPPSYAYP